MTAAGPPGGVQPVLPVCNRAHLAAYDLFHAQGFLVDCCGRWACSTRSHSRIAPDKAWTQTWHSLRSRRSTRAPRPTVSAHDISPPGFVEIGRPPSAAARNSSLADWQSTPGPLPICMRTNCCERCKMPEFPRPALPTRSASGTKRERPLGCLCRHCKGSHFDSQCPQPARDARTNDVGTRHCRVGHSTVT